ncbi:MULTISPECIES: hypothetical protein [unclassified Streptomyces]|uniref:hypothetical protein n=1 Tax=unclassified Streptomyces TaxID=2593676 RepID=UPI0037FBA706
MMIPPESANAALELERLRGAVTTGFAELNGRLDTALQRTGQTEKDIAELETRLAALERARWPLPGLAVLAGLAGVGTSVIALYR